MTIPVSLFPQLVVGNPQAEAELYKLICKGEILHYTIRKVGYDLAPDVCHDVYMAILTMIRKGSIREPEKIGSLFSAIYRNTVIKSRRLIKVSSPEEPMEIPVKETPESLLKNKQRKELLGKKILRLNTVDQKIIHLFYFEGESKEKIRSVLNLTETQFNLRKSRAIGSLRKMLHVA